MWATETIQLSDISYRSTSESPAEESSDEEGKAEEAKEEKGFAWRQLVYSILGGVILGLVGFLFAWCILRCYRKKKKDVDKDRVPDPISDYPLPTEFKVYNCTITQFPKPNPAN